MRNRTWLFPGSIHLVDEVLHHDTSEPHVTGFKQNLSPFTRCFGPTPVLLVWLHFSESECLYCCLFTLLIRPSVAAFSLLSVPDDSCSLTEGRYIFLSLFKQKDLTSHHSTNLSSVLDVVGFDLKHFFLFFLVLRIFLYLEIITCVCHVRQMYRLVTEMRLQQV